MKPGHINTSTLLISNTILGPGCPVKPFNDSMKYHQFISCLTLTHFAYLYILSLVTSLPLSFCFQALRRYFPGGFFGEDRDGHPVYYDFYGNIDIKGKDIENGVKKS